MNTAQATPAPLNERTVQMYERWAHNYALLLDELPDADRRSWLERVCMETGPCGEVLEVGSGTGRDADYLESLGLCVDRTDAAEAFLMMQRDRGHSARRVNIISDDLLSTRTRGYDAIVAMCVLIHVDRHIVPSVLRKIHAALRRGGVFLVSMREGTADVISDRSFTSVWLPGTFERLLIEGGYTIEGSGRYVDSDGDVWRTLLCRRSAEAGTCATEAASGLAAVASPSIESSTAHTNDMRGTDSGELTPSKARLIVRRLLRWLFVDKLTDQLDRSPEYSRAKGDASNFQLRRSSR